MSTKLEKLKQDLKGSLILPDFVRPRAGLPTGLPNLNQFLLGNGLPTGALSLAKGSIGSGLTHFFSQTAHHLLQKKRWVAWIYNEQFPLQPHLFQFHELSRLLLIKAPTDSTKLLWVLQETLSLGLFDLVGCDLLKTSFSERSLIQLKKIARQQSSAVLFLDFDHHQRARSSFELILELTPQRIYIERALQKPTPKSMERRSSYENIMSQLTGPRRSISG